MVFGGHRLSAGCDGRRGQEPRISSGFEQVMEACPVTCLPQSGLGYLRAAAVGFRNATLNVVSFHPKGF